MAKTKEKLTALKLRKQGESIKDIASKLKVSKGSVSVWCEEIKLTKKQTERLMKKQIKSGAIGRQIGANKNKEKRLQTISQYEKEGLHEIGNLSKRDLFIPQKYPVPSGRGCSEPHILSA